MAIQKRRNQRSEYVSSTCPPGWAWLLAGIIIGMFISFLIYLREFAPQLLPPESAQALNPPITNVSEPADNFQFYDDLSGNTGKSSHSGFPITVPGRYLLQVGSFKDKQGAEGLKKYLASIGVSAYVEATGLGETGRWYQVLVGPFTDLNQLNQTHELLAKNKIEMDIKKY
ncbi:MAG: hypothetical protein DRQ49_01215 [Gammaproteobacteria bacterium]|nr:MAG: hypothetical protein DRQ49_01215 [Gammaproteobacteria bacterium]RKZ76691.1 MAG: hypothetical protein DRQ57_02995 [Gammaproteobacteria bacterium]